MSSRNSGGISVGLSEASVSLSNRPFRAVGDDGAVARVVGDLRFSATTEDDLHLSDGRFSNTTADGDDGTVKEVDACSCVTSSIVVGIIAIIIIMMFLQLGDYYK